MLVRLKQPGKSSSSLSLTVPTPLADWMSICLRHNPFFFPTGKRRASSHQRHYEKHHSYCVFQVEPATRKRQAVFISGNSPSLSFCQEIEKVEAPKEQSENHRPAVQVQ
jgi:hypothetical protein